MDQKTCVAGISLQGSRRWEIPLGPDSQEGEDWAAFGEYRELVPEKKIVFTWQWDDDEAWEKRTSVVTIEFFERRGGTELRFKHEQLPIEEIARSPQ